LQFLAIDDNRIGNEGIPELAMLFINNQKILNKLSIAQNQVN
jgi:hypothetical protein